jgi:D-glycero-D-manno-heptose 1,7-bisphosphate phosphatase
MALRADVVGDRFGRVVLDGDRVRSFIAPGQGAPVRSMPASTSSTAASLPRRRPPASLEQDVFPALAAAGAMTGTSYRGYFIDIGIPEISRAPTSN